VSIRAQTPVAISDPAAARSNAAAQDGRSAAKKPGIATRNPDRACHPFMSTPRTTSDVAASPVEKSGLTMMPGMLQTSTAIEPRMAAHCAGASGRWATSRPDPAGPGAALNLVMIRTVPKEH
jgi:hypothetical protein